MKKEILNQLIGEQILDIKEDEFDTPNSLIHVETTNFKFDIQATYEGWPQIINIEKKYDIVIDECMVCNYVGNISHDDDGQECCPNCYAVNQFRKTNKKG